MNTTNNNFIKKLESHTDNYTCISNEINLRMVAEPVADKRPSANAFALYHYLIKLPDNWSLSCDAIAKFFNWGKDKVRIVMNELISLGYLCKVRLNNEQLRGFSYKYIFFETVDCQYQFLVDLISNKDTSVSLMNADLLMDSNHKILNHTETVWYKHVYVRKPAEVQESFPYRCFPVVETPVVETPVVETPVVETPVVDFPPVENTHVLYNKYIYSNKEYNKYSNQCSSSLNKEEDQNKNKEQKTNMIKTKSYINEDNINESNFSRNYLTMTSLESKLLDEQKDKKGRARERKAQQKDNTKKFENVEQAIGTQKVGDLDEKDNEISRLRKQNQILETERKEKETAEGKRRTHKSRVNKFLETTYMHNPELVQCLKDFADMYVQRRSVLTVPSFKLLLEDLKKITTDENKMIEIVKNSTKRSYLEFYPDCNNGNGLVNSGKDLNLNKNSFEVTTNPKTDSNKLLDNSYDLSKFSRNVY